MKPEITTVEDIHPQSKMEELTDDVRSYVTTVFELYKLKMIDKVSSIAGSVTAYASLILIALITIVLLSIGAAAWINIALNSTFAGFFIVAGVYVIIGLIILSTHNSAIKKPVTSAVIKHILSED